MKIPISIKAVALAAAFLMPASAGAHAAQAGSTASALLARAEETLQQASSFRADFAEIDTYPGKYRDLAQRGTVTLSRPGLLHLSIRRFRRISAGDPWAPSGNDTLANSDGATYTYAFLHPHSTQVRTERTSPTALASALRQLPPIAGFFGAPSHDGISGGGEAASLAPPAVWQGAKYQVVRYQVTTRSGQEATAEAYIGGDNLIHRLIYRTETSQGEAVREWDLSHIVLNAPVSASDFAYTPPTDATPLVSDRSGDLLAAGTPAPDFTVQDSRGRPVKLSDFRGKTVVLDFWATWCWPCNQFLPHVESVAEANQANSVVVLAVAIWDSKTGFDLWIKRHHYSDIDFAIDPSPQGKDVASALYGVSATPTAYVIGPDGKIVRAIAGYSGPNGALEAAILAARRETHEASVPAQRVR